MKATSRRVSIGVWLALASAIACGERVSFAPTAPTPVPGAPAASEGAVIEGSVRMAAAAPVLAAEAGAALTVRVVGTSLEATIGPTGQFTLTGVPAGDVRLHFTGPGVDAQIVITQVLSGEVITISVTLTSTAAAVDQQIRRGGAEKVELEGRIESVPPTMPAGTLVVAGRTVRTDASTVIRQGDASRTFADLLVGMRVHVKGRMDGAAIVASEIRIQNTHTDLSVELKGIVEALSGNELAFQFTLAGRLVKGDADTEFGGEGTRTSFTDLRNGVRVEVKGQQRDGFVYAVRIHVHTDGPKEEDVELSGTVSGLSGTCPTLRFQVGTTPVTTDAATRFDGGACSAVANGVRVEVEGVRQPDGTVRARKVKMEKAEEVEIKGTITSVSGTCPALSMVVSSQRVVTSSATRFDGGSCSALKTGDRIEARGTRQADGSILATRIKKEN